MWRMTWRAFSARPYSTGVPPQENEAAAPSQPPSHARLTWPPWPPRAASPPSPHTPAQPPKPRLTWPPFPQRPASPPFPPAPLRTDPPAAAAGAGEAPFAALLSFCTGDKFAVMGKLANLNHNAYAARHGYDFVQGSAETMPHMHFIEPPVWLKAGHGLATTG